MIDNQTYKVMHPDSTAFENSYIEHSYSFDRFPSTIFHDDVLDESALILLPANVYGFYLKEKKWGEYHS